MEGKPKISPNHTFVFDEEDIEALDELSMTSVIGEVTDSLSKRELAAAQTDEPPAAAAARSAPSAQPEFDPDIMELMREINEDK